MTAFIGAYAFVRGISLYAGGFINEIAIIEHTEEALKDLKASFGFYIAGIIFTFIVGVLVQKRQQK